MCNILTILTYKCIDIAIWPLESSIPIRFDSTPCRINCIWTSIARLSSFQMLRVLLVTSIILAPVHSGAWDTVFGERVPGDRLVYETTFLKSKKDFHFRFEYLLDLDSSQVSYKIEPIKEIQRSSNLISSPAAEPDQHHKDRGPRRE